MKILVVDDDPQVARALSRILAKEGHSVVLTDSGSDALFALSGIAFDAILSDVDMPGMTGIQLYKHVQEAHPHMKNHFGFMTGNPSAVEVLDVPYIAKPSEKTAIVGLLRYLTGNGVSAEA